jgi:muramoyltetrapeptide carboxypeptidase
MLVSPPKVRPGDRIVVVASSSPFETDKLGRGVAWLRERYVVEHRDDLLARDGYLAGDDARRRVELQAALDARGVRAIVAARGGYGLSRIVGDLDWRGFSSAPKWIVGFSDVTALHVEAHARGHRSLHAPMVAWLGDANGAALASWSASLEGGATSWASLVVATRGVRADDRIEGVAFGGNVAMLHDCAAARRLRVPEQAIVFLEDVGERPYRVDRMLTALIAGGAFASAQAIVVGDFTDCAPGRDGVTIDAVVRERLSTIGCPVLMGAPFGHGARNEAFVVGATTTLAIDGETATLVQA